MKPDEQEAATVEKSREDFKSWLSGPDSFLAAFARYEIPVGQSLRFGAEGDVVLPDAGSTVQISADNESFHIDGVRRGPGAILPLGRYRLRLSHQNAPAVVILDPDAPRQPLEARWYPYDAAFRLTLPLEPNRTRLALGSTREQARAAERVGWVSFKLGGRSARLAVTRLVEPGVPADKYEIFFRDLTSGHRTYQLGRYLDLIPAGDGQYLVDFNRAYNPACAYSPHYNCPIPPDENRLPIAIAAGEMTPH